MSYDGLVTFLRTADLDRAEDFYSGLLGLDRVLDQGGCRISRVSSSGFLGVCGGTPEPQGVIVSLVAAGGRERCAELERRGFVSRSPCRTTPTSRMPSSVSPTAIWWRCNGSNRPSGAVRKPES